MNKEVARKWVEALRSGEYEQTQLRLRRGDSYCCLGVLCDLYRKDVGGHWIGGSGETFVAPDGIEDCCVTPHAVDDWAGIQTTYDDYAEMNDNGASFLEIASQIERDAGLLDLSESPSQNTSEISSSETKHEA